MIVGEPEEEATSPTVVKLSLSVSGSPLMQCGTLTTGGISSAFPRQFPLYAAYTFAAHFNWAIAIQNLCANSDGIYFLFLFFTF